MSVLSKAYNWISSKALNFCAKRGYTRGLKALIWLGFNVNATDAQKNTPLHIACAVGNIEVIEILLSANADVNALNLQLCPPQDSTNYNNYELIQKTIAKFFITKGKNASTNMRNANGQTPADLYAATNEQPQQMPTPVERTSSISKAVTDEYATHIVKRGLSAAPITAIPEIKGMPLFHYAAKCGLINILNYLLGIGKIDVNTKHAGKTALHYATEGCQVEATTILVNAGSDTLALDLDERTPLFDAIQGYETNTLQSFADNALTKEELVTDKEIYSKKLIDKEAAAKADLFLKICIAIIDPSDKESIGSFAKQPIERYGYDRANYYSLLHYAVKKKANRIHVGELLDLKILKDVRGDGDIVIEKAACTPDRDAALPLHIALELDLQDVAKLLLLIEDNNSQNKFAYLNLRERTNNRTPLDIAAKAGNLEVVNKLLELNVKTNVNSITTSFAQQEIRINTPLTYAAQYNNIDVALVLIPHSDVKAEYDFEWKAEILPPVYYAAAHGNDRLVKALLNAGANFRVRHFVGSEYDGRRIYKFETLLHVAARLAKDAVVIETLIRNGANPHAIGLDGKTMLHDAAENKVFNTMNCFLRMNVEVNRQDNKGNTALHLALKNNNFDAAQSLISAPGIDFSLHNGDGDTALHIAVRLNLVAMIKSLLDAGADINSARNTDGATLLHTAISHDALDALILLLTRNPNVTQTNKAEQTPLQYAVTWRIREDKERKHPSLETHLIPEAKNKAKAIMHILKYKKNNNETLNEVNSAGQDLMHLATNGWSREAISVLHTYGIDLDIKNPNQETPLAVAAENTNTCYEPYRHVRVVNTLMFRGANIDAAVPTLNDATFAKRAAIDTTLFWYKHYFTAKNSGFSKLSRRSVDKILGFCLGTSELVKPIIDNLGDKFEARNIGAQERYAEESKRKGTNPALKAKN